MIKYKVITQSTGRYNFTMHKDGCSAIEKEVMIERIRPTTVKGDNWQEARSNAIDEDMLDMGFTTTDIHVHECCKKGV